MVSKDAVLTWLRAAADVYAENRAYLTQLDSDIGDADHGINMDRGFKKVVEKLPDLADKDIGALLKGVGMTLVSTVGGASGPLYGTFFMRAGMATDGKDELGPEDVLALFDAGYQGILQRGKAELGDKTMVDAMHPAVDALRSAVEAGQPLAEALRSARDAAEGGMHATTPLQARKGRASYLGERSIGHQDPGATSTYLLFRTTYDVWGEDGE